MSTRGTTEDRQRVLVSDFDGTMTRHDFYKLAIESLLPADVPDYWSKYRDGTVTHFEALRLYFGSIRKSEQEVMRVVERMELDPQLPAAIQALRSAGWRIIIASAGCDWYIRRLLSASGLEIEVHANPGHFDEQHGLVMQLPTASRYFSSMLGIDKAGVVKKFLDEGAVVAFAGDGFPDADPARLVPGELRFARGDLEDVMQSEGLSFHPYESWSDIATILLK